MKVVYIAHPIGGVVAENKKAVYKILREVSDSNPNIVPFAPYLVDIEYLDDEIPEERSRGLANSCALLRSGVVNEMWLYGDVVSDGMVVEMRVAIDCGIPIVCKSREVKNILTGLIDGLRSN